jgi:hypothetical protein
MRNTKTKRLHLDRRAAEIAEKGAGGDDDDLLSTIQLAAWLGVSHQFLEIARHRGSGGPPFVKIGKTVRYQRGAVRKWLAERVHLSIAEYRETA